MKHLTPLFAMALLGAALTAQAAEVAPAAAAPQAKATSSPTAKPANKPGGATPVAGGSNSGGVTDGSNTGTQVKPKIPKCPDPNETACAAVKTPAK
jgi:hypothetical protein